MHSTVYQTYAERSDRKEIAPLSVYLLRLIHLKCTNLAISANVSTTNELLHLAEDVGDHICVLKTHGDTISDFNEKTIHGLNEVSQRKKFLIFEDRKFAENDDVLQHQFTGGLLKIARWAPIVSAHILDGPSVISSLSRISENAMLEYNSSVTTDISTVSIADAKDRLIDVGVDEPKTGLFIAVSTTISTQTTSHWPSSQLGSLRDCSPKQPHRITCKHGAELRSALDSLGPRPLGHAVLLDADIGGASPACRREYAAACLRKARTNRKFVVGFLTQRGMNESDGDDFISIAADTSEKYQCIDGQQGFHACRELIKDAGTDVVIVDSASLSTFNIGREALEFRQQAWAAYVERIESQKTNSIL